MPASVPALQSLPNQRQNQRRNQRQEPGGPGRLAWVVSLSLC
jgi:hypothetical protein